MNSKYGLPPAPIATVTPKQKQEMVSPQYGTPIFREYDHDTMLLDLFGTFDGETYDVMDVAITGTRFSVMRLVDAIHTGDRSLLEDMNLWCERQHEKEMAAANATADEDNREFAREIQHGRI